MDNGKIRFGKQSGGQLTFVRVNKGKQWAEKKSLHMPWLKTELYINKWFGGISLQIKITIKKNV